MRLRKIVALFPFIVLSFGLSGCGSSEPSFANKPASADRISISPASAAAGSSDVMLTVMGSNFHDAPHDYSQVMWSQSGSNTPLATTFVNTTTLTAVIPSVLLANSIAAQVFVQTGDPMGDAPLAKSVSVVFAVIAPGTGQLMITSISPQSASTGSPDLTLTVMGANFIDGKPHKHNVLVWTANGKSTFLTTTFVSSSELTAVIPSALMSNPVTAQVDVEIWDFMGDAPESRSNSTPFVVNSVTSASIKAPSLLLSFREQPWRKHNSVCMTATCFRQRS